MLTSNLGFPLMFGYQWAYRKISGRTGIRRLCEAKWLEVERFIEGCYEVTLEGQRLGISDTPPLQYQRQTMRSPLC